MILDQKSGFGFPKETYPCYSLLSISAVDLLENKDVWLNEVKRSRSNAVIGGFRSIWSISVFLGQSAFPVIMIDSMQKLGFEVQSSYVIESSSDELQ